MAKKTETHEVEVKRLEEGKGKLLRVVFTCCHGEYPIETERKNRNLFEPGRKYRGIFTVVGSPDFIGDEDKWENICTLSYCLETIVDDKGSILIEDKK